MVHIPTLEGWNLILMTAVAIARATCIDALVLGRMGGREAARDGIILACIEGLDLD
jgi:hypothetical protein